MDASQYHWLLEFRDLVKEVAAAHALHPEFVAAFVSTESAGIPEVTRYEKEWSFFHQPVSDIAAKLKITVATEQMAQSHSYGLMQIMGATARDLGYEGYLHELCQPKLGLEFGCRYLAQKQLRYQDLGDLISSYNAGTPRKNTAGYMNQQYVDTVMNHLANLKGEFT